MCRNNINGEEANNTNNSSNLLNENGPTFFNIIPFPPEPTSSSTSSNPSNNSSSSTSSSSTSSQRRNNLNLRNHNLYRIHIRPNLNESQRSESSNEDPIGHRISRGIRITTRLSNDNQDSQNYNSNNSSRSNSTNSTQHHLNLNQMMRQFMSRHQTLGLYTNIDSDANVRSSSIRVTTRLSNPPPEPITIDEGSNSRFSNMMQHLMNQFRQVDRTRSVNRQADGGGNSDDDVIEIEPEAAGRRDDDNPGDELPNAKRRRV